ncbi:MAG: hypothetical protein HKN05_01725 [Rhizobiales bacterium]|nr:hypothetical protein [Hyphomicrobiales bacterium]
MALEHVIFDCDGVLIDSERAKSSLRRAGLGHHFGSHVYSADMAELPRLLEML